MENLNKCNRLKHCSINVCPLDKDANLRNELKGEERCPYCLKKKSTAQKGTRTLATDSILTVVPESNIKMLNNRNQKRWHDIQSKLSNKNDQK